MAAEKDVSEKRQEVSQEQNEEQIEEIDQQCDEEVDSIICGAPQEKFNKRAKE